MRIVVALVAAIVLVVPLSPARAQPPGGLVAPELTGGTDWLGTNAPLSLKELRGKIVLLDFWTYCCINCMQTLPELAKLEKKYAKQVVVIGVHSPKFEGERDTMRIRQAMQRYEIAHPVYNDAKHAIWKAYEVNWWPTLILIDPEGFIVGRSNGEKSNTYEITDEAIAQQVKIHRAKKTLNEELLPFQKAQNVARTSPLYYPGKVLADAAGKRLFIADSTNHRIVVTDLNGQHQATIGTGKAGATDGSYARAQFNEPQGMALKNQILYVADRRNHMIRAVDLKTKMVRTIAGNGKPGWNRTEGGPALRTGLSSPWALHVEGNALFIANAGSFQLWVLELGKGVLSPWAGNGMEELTDGERAQACLAQPSGMSSDGTYLYFADSETSSIRFVAMDGKGPVQTIVGKGLFDFGDKDGTGDEVRMQHCMDVAWVEGDLYVIDTYNHKLKKVDRVRRTCTTVALESTDAGDTGALFSEPGGLSHANGKLYVADTNAHRIRVVDLKTKKVSTLVLTGVSKVGGG
jgi:thiol-disulfide isomerase/thioredoxin